MVQLFYIKYFYPVIFDFVPQFIFFWFIERLSFLFKPVFNDVTLENFTNKTNETQIDVKIQ